MRRSRAREPHQSGPSPPEPDPRRRLTGAPGASNGLAGSAGPTGSGVAASVAYASGATASARRADGAAGAASSRTTRGATEQTRGRRRPAPIEARLADRRGSLQVAAAAAAAGRRTGEVAAREQGSGASEVGFGARPPDADLLDRARPDRPRRDGVAIATDGLELGVRLGRSALAKPSFASNAVSSVDGARQPGRRGLGRDRRALREDGLRLGEQARGLAELPGAHRVAHGARELPVAGLGRRPRRNRPGRPSGHRAAAGRCLRATHVRQRSSNELVECSSSRSSRPRQSGGSDTVSGAADAAVVAAPSPAAGG